MTSNPVPSGSACRDIEHHYHEGHYHEGRYGAGRYDPDGHADTNWPTEGEAGDEQTLDIPIPVIGPCQHHLPGVKETDRHGTATRHRD